MSSWNRFPANCFCKCYMQMSKSAYLLIFILKRYEIFINIVPIQQKLHYFCRKFNIIYTLNFYFMNYFKHNTFRGRFRSFPNYRNTHLKSIREDFNDMFCAEARMREERKDMSLVFCLTYNDEHLRKFYGNNVLDAKDLERFSKASAFGKRINALGYEFDLISLGEYGNGGESHHFKGKRGKGQNPHFHCVAWFHHVDKSKKPADYNYLCHLVRMEWQGCDIDNPVLYARNYPARKKGLGYVSLDGPIESPEKGGSYCSKYMGKSMSLRFQEVQFSHYCQEFVNIVHDLVKEFADVKLSDVMSLLAAWYHVSFDTSRNAILNDRLIGTNIGVLADLFAIPFDNLSPLFVTTQEYWFEEITNHYIMFDDEFSAQWRNRHSPKLRKFHGFGYSLLDDCNQLEGTYNITKDGGSVKRNLPPSLARKLYYNYQSVDSPYNGMSGLSKVVLYFPSDLGLKHFAFVAQKRMDMLRSRYKSIYANGLVSRVIITEMIGHIDTEKVDIVSTDDKFDIPSDVLDQIVRFYVCVLPMDVASEDSLNCWHDIVVSDDSAAKYFANAHKSYLVEGEELIVDTRPFVNARSWFINNFPNMVKYLDILECIDKIAKEQHDCSDREYIEKWERVYATQY